MASDTDIQRVKRLTDNPEGYTDEQISALIDSAGTVELAVHQIWQEKAAQYASLVDTSESGSSRSLGSLYKNALAMAEKFRPAEAADGGPVGGAKRTRPVSRG